jgi:hypothetical protein
MSLCYCTRFRQNTFSNSTEICIILDFIQPKHFCSTNSAGRNHVTLESIAETGPDEVFTLMGRY